MPDILRDYQSEALFALLEKLKSDAKSNPLVCMPTGTGKGLVIAEFVRGMIQCYFPNARFMMLTHVKELIDQNAKKLQHQWSVAPLGIYSAGLNSRDMAMPIIFGGIQSVAKAIQRFVADTNNMMTAPQYRHFGWRDFVLIDEAHLLSPDEASMYAFVIAELRKINPALVVIGFTATPYRMKQGMLTDGGLFTDIAYDITNIDGFNRLLAQGYLSPLVAKHTEAQINVSNVSLNSDGEFNQKQLDKVTDNEELVFAIVRETIVKTQDRLCGLYFASSIDNAEHVTWVFQKYGVSAECVHSKLKSKVNDEKIAAYKNGDIKWLVNMGKLTTGFDHPPIDAIAFGAATNSVGRYVQMGGRGTRPSPSTGKINCLGLDYAGNRRRLGPMNDPKIPNKSAGGGGDMPVRICEMCAAYNHASARFCEACGHEFSFRTKLVETPNVEEFIRNDGPVVEIMPVSRVFYRHHQKEGKPPSICVEYLCGMRTFKEWVCLEHPGFVGKRARQWWTQRFNGEAPATTHEALQFVSQLRVPSAIRVHLNKDYPEILGHEF